MIFTPTPLSGVWCIDPEPIQDARGCFARTWSAAEFAAHGLEVAIAECATSYNALAGTVRGMHLQAAPHEEHKLVRCTRGAIFDVALDLRPGSETFGRWTALQLTADNRRMMSIPPGVAHGFQTLEDASEVAYQISARHAPASARGVHHADPAFEISWPRPVTALSERDRTWPWWRDREETP